MAIMTTSNNKWKLTQNISAAGTITKTLATSGLYVDRNIDIETITPAGNYNVSDVTSSRTNSTVTPVINISNTLSATNSSYGITSSVPNSGEYFSFVPNATSTNWSVTPQATITAAGYINTGSKTGTAISATPILESVLTNYYIPIVTPAFSGGTLTSTNYENTPTITLSNGSQTNMSNINLGNQNTTTYPYYFKVDASSGALTGTTSVTRGAITYTNSAGIITAHTNDSVLSESSQSATVTINSGSQSIYVNLKEAIFTFTGGALNNTQATATFVNSNNKVISTANSDTYNNGLTVLAKGTASRSAVTYTNTAGYFPAHSSSQTASSSPGTTSWDGTTYYLTGVKIAAPSSGIAKFDITVPNGSTSSFITFQFQVDSSGNVTVQGP